VTQNQTSTATKRISAYLMLIVLVVLALSIASLLLAAGSYISNPDNPLPAAFLAIIGLIAMTMSLFTLYQSRRQAVEMKIEIPKVMTTIECKKCGEKTVREYQRGDYVFKELDPCQKCLDTKQIITAIYKEVKEKEKTYAV
jgi:predicted ferric reductase